MKGWLGGAEFPRSAPPGSAHGVGGCRSAGGELGAVAAQCRALQGSGQAAFPEYAKLFVCFSSMLWEGSGPSSFCWEPEGAGVLPLGRHSRRGLGSRAGVMSHLQAAAVS